MQPILTIEMSSGRYLHVTKSIDRRAADRIDGKKYADKLGALDKNGELNMEQFIDAVEQVIKGESQYRILKWLLAALTVLSSTSLPLSAWPMAYLRWTATTLS